MNPSCATGRGNDPRLVPKLLGADVELGNYVLGMDCAGGTGKIASRALLAEIDGVPQSAWTCSSNATYVFNPQDWGRKFLPTNGGCIYIDLQHLELCPGETRSAHDFVAAWHAMLLIARQAMDAANARLQPGRRIQVLVNNSDGLGNSYGSHLNCLVSRRLWNNIFHYRPHYMALLASFQVSSIVYAGQGKVGAENGQPPVDYQLAQRADFFESVVGIQTTADRPLVNSRDESHCGPKSYGSWDRRDQLPYARLHCIFYDSNLCHVANLLKAGVMQMVLAVMEAEQTPPQLILDDPLRSVVAYSHDPTLRARCRMADGRRLTAVELQMLFCEHLMQFDARGGFDGVVPRAAEILALYADTLDKLRARDFDALARRLDWVLKRQVLDRALARRRGLTWDGPDMKRLDHLYSSLDADGFYWLYEQSGAVERVVGPGQVERFVHQPPDDTRAYTRAMLLRAAQPGQFNRVDWDSISLRFYGRSGWPTYRTLEMHDPLGMTRAETGALFESGASVEEVLDVLMRDGVGGSVSHDTWSIGLSADGLRVDPAHAAATPTEPRLLLPAPASVPSPRKTSTTGDEEDK